MNTLFAATLLVLGQGPRYSVPQLGLMAASEYVTSGTEELLKKLDAVHAKALVHFRSLPKSQLRSELEPVFKKYGIRTIQGAGAAYVMALHGVEIERNVGRLNVILQTWSDQRQWPDPDGWWDVIDGAPEAMADIFLRTGYRPALVNLVTFAGDAHIAEEQADQVARVFLKRPDEVLVVSRSPKARKALAEQLGYSEDGNVPKLLKQLERSGKYREEARRLSSAIDSVR